MRSDIRPSEKIPAGSVCTQWISQPGPETTLLLFDGPRRQRGQELFVFCQKRRISCWLINLPQAERNYQDATTRRRPVLAHIVSPSPHEHDAEIPGVQIFARVVSSSRKIAFKSVSSSWLPAWVRITRRVDPATKILSRIGERGHAQGPSDQAARRYQASLPPTSPKSDLLT